MKQPLALPPLAHLQRLTDDTGVQQFATHGVPNPHFGYTLDDNVRALLVTSGYYQHGVERDLAAALTYRYLAFIRWAQRPDGRFHNELSYDRRWLDEVGSEDALGRTVWALGYAVACPLHSASMGAAADMLGRALPYVQSLCSPRARAYAALGVAHLVRVSHPHGQQHLLVALASSLLDDVQRHAQAEWRWFEPGLTYDNGRLPQALLIAGQLLSDRQYLTVAQELLDFLLAQVVEDGVVVPIGQAGWYWRGKAKARYDQQPIDAASLVEVCATASIVLGEARYWDIALAAWAWFYGRNSEHLVLYDAQTSGCHDGLRCSSVNDNQGAESTLALLQASLALNDLNWLGVTEDRLAKASVGSRD